MAKLSPVFNDQTFDANGSPAVGYKLFTYAAGSSAKQTTFSDEAGAVPNSNPIILNADGWPTQGPIWLTEGQTYKFVLALPDDSDPPTSPVKTIDNVIGVGDSTVSFSQWQASGATPTYVSADTFTLVGDQTSDFHPGRRVQFIVSAGAVFGNIISSVFTSLTEVTMQMDAGMALDSGLSVANLSVLRADHLATPSIVNQSFSMQGASIIAAKGNSVPVAGTTEIWSETDGNLIHLTGTGTITSLGSAPQAGARMTLIVDSAGVIFTHSADLSCPNNSNIVSAAGDRIEVISDTETSHKIVGYARAGTSVYIGSFTRDAASLTQLIDYTGVGFKPKKITFLSNISGGSVWSSGVDNGTGKTCIYADGGGVVRSSIAGSIIALVSGLNSQSGLVSSMNNDGFTISWVKSGNPTGAMTVNYIAEM